MATIAAIITAPGEAAISAIRISGAESWNIIQKISEVNLQERQAELAWIKKADEKLDQVIIIPFKAPKSFTGEDVIEIHSHGGYICVTRILELILEKGARLAKAGEFSEQAVLNGKMNLVQAEAINDLITAKTELARKNALEIYKGSLGSKIQEIRTRMMQILGEITASIDFPDEVGSYDKEKYKQLINNLIKEIEEISQTEKQGEILRHGYKVALIGQPNVGKSTLLNKLLKRDRAIVTEIAGTTRDSIEEFYNLDGYPIVLIDTAGIRESDDLVEKIGIEKTQSIAKDADLVLELIDLSVKDSHIQDHDSIKIGTKADLDKKSSVEVRLEISEQSEKSIEALKELIKEKINLLVNSEASFNVNQRQAELLREAKEALKRSITATELSEDFWTIDLKNAIYHLGEITGESLTEEILDNIFSRFCIGK